MVRIKLAQAVCCTQRDFCIQWDLELKESFIFMINNTAFCPERTSSQLLRFLVTQTPRGKENDLDDRIIRALQSQHTQTCESVRSPWQITSQQPWFIKSIHIYLYSNLHCVFFPGFNSIGSSTFFSSPSYLNNVHFNNPYKKVILGIAKSKICTEIFSQN